MLQQRRVLKQYQKTAGNFNSKHGFLQLKTSLIVMETRTNINIKAAAKHFIQAQTVSSCALEVRINLSFTV